MGKSQMTFEEWTKKTEEAGKSLQGVNHRHAAMERRETQEVQGAALKDILMTINVALHRLSGGSRFFEESKSDVSSPRNKAMKKFLETLKAGCTSEQQDTHELQYGKRSVLVPTTQNHLQFIKEQLENHMPDAVSHHANQGMLARAFRAIAKVLSGVGLPLKQFTQTQTQKDMASVEQVLENSSLPRPGMGSSSS